MALKYFKWHRKYQPYQFQGNQKFKQIKIVVLKIYHLATLLSTLKNERNLNKSQGWQLCKVHTFLHMTRFCRKRINIRVSRLAFEKNAQNVAISIFGQNL
jgi:hypothetical protein